MFEVSKQVSLRLSTVASLSFGEFESQDDHAKEDVNQLSVHLYLHLCSNAYLLSLACQNMFMHQEN